MDGPCKGASAGKNTGRVEAQIGNPRADRRKRFEGPVELGAPLRVTSPGNDAWTPHDDDPCYCTDDEQCHWCREADAEADRRSRERSAAVEARYYEGLAEAIGYDEFIDLP